MVDETGRMTISSRTLLHTLGSILSVFGVAFVVLQIARYGSELDVDVRNNRFWVIVALCSFIYATANLLLVSAWAGLLRHLGPEVTGRLALTIYGTTLPAKYIPGNIMHLAGRQAVGVANGIDGWALARATLFELALIITAGVPFAFLLMPQLTSCATPLFSTGLFVATSIGMTVSIRMVLGYGPSAAFLKQLLFLAVSASVFVALMTVILDEPEMPLSRIATISGGFVIAWVAGLVTPGAPAGAGVRELILMTSLSTLAEGPAILTAALLSRLVTILGDTLFFVFSVLATREERQD